MGISSLFFVSWNLGVEETTWAVATVKLAATEVGAAAAFIFPGTVWEPVERVLLFELVELFECSSPGSPDFFELFKNLSFSSSNSKYELSHF